MVLTVYILSITYALFIFWCIAGWLKLPRVNAGAGTVVAKLFVSVIIPARNEEENIIGCLEDFLTQDYPGDSFEIIVVNDHSTDATVALVRKFIETNPGIKARLIELIADDENSFYKKQAITKGIDSASGTLIITTDADCRRGPKWLSTIAGYYNHFHPELISAPVFLEDEQTWIEKIQSLEFVGLVAIGAAGIRNAMPMLCNGANLAFPKSVFYEVNGYHSKNNTATGDDTQLLMKIIPRGKKNIHFIKSDDGIVTTKAKQTISELLRQRQRWASKIPLHMNMFTICIAAVAFFLHMGLIFVAIQCFIAGNAALLIFPFLIKVIPEFIFLAIVCRFARKSQLLYLFLPAQIIYPIYISFVGVTSLFGTHQWKGRIQ
jgi:cellulose synthase/poly-beta-1,6-N-acetylglucosamine synthase-like glycosyltransferase